MRNIVTILSRPAPGLRTIVKAVHLFHQDEVRDSESRAVILLANHATFESGLNVWLDNQANVTGYRQEK